jgi:hypothetical protein
MTRITLYFTPQQIARLDRSKGETGLSVAEIVRRAVDSYLVPTTTQAVPDPTGLRAMSQVVDRLSNIPYRVEPDPCEGCDWAPVMCNGPETCERLKP